MINKEPGNTLSDTPGEKIFDLGYLAEMMGNKKQLIKEIIDAFLPQISEELRNLTNAIEKADYKMIRNISHTIKSTVSVMGITILAPILQEIETLGTMSIDIEKIRALNTKLNVICKQAISQIETEKNNYE